MNGSFKDRVEGLLLWVLWERFLQEVSGDRPYKESIEEFAAFPESIVKAIPTEAHKDSVLSMLEAVEEPPDKIVDNLESAIQFLLLIILQQAREFAIQVTDTLPKPPGARPPTASQEEREAIYGEILRMVGSGVSVAEAKRRIGRQRSISGKTVDRIWKGRGSREMTRDEAERFFRSLIED